jgi:plasmid replication initiation protein
MIDFKIKINGFIFMDKNTPLVVKSNALIEASYRLSLTEQRTMLSAISKIRCDEQVTDEVMYSVDAKDIILAGSNPKHAYRDLKSSAESIFDRRITFHEYSEEGVYSKLITRWTQSIRYIESQGRIELRFNRDIIPYLTKLKREFTRYNIEDIANMDSVHSIRLFELLIQWEKIGERIISLNDFKKMLQIEDKYSSIKDLKKYVLLPAVNQINGNSPLNVTWEQQKNGRKITHLKFIFSRKKSKLLASPSKQIMTKQKMAQQAKPGETWEDLKTRLKQKEPEV